MAKILDVQEMANFIFSLRDPIIRGANLALLETTINAVAEAKKLVMKNFKGSRDRPKSGQLASAIFPGFEQTGSKAAEAFVGVSSKKGDAGTKPYGRIQEYGGEIKNKRANWLWIPLFGPKSTGVKGKYKNVTPTEFIDLMKQNRAFMVPTRSGLGWVAFVDDQWATPSPKGVTLRGDKTKVPLFILRKKVEIPANPYVTPAVEKEYGKLPARIKKRVEQELGGK